MHREVGSILALLVWVLAAGAPQVVGAQQAQPPRVGLLVLERNERLAQLGSGLHALGLIDGKTVRIEMRSAEGHFDRLPSLATELVNLPVDVLVTLGGPTVLRAARHASATVPIVSAIMNDPVAEGFVDSLSRPGGNITGQALDEAAVVKQVEALQEAVPALKALAVIWHQAGTGERVLREVDAAARARGLTLHLQQIRTAGDIAAAVAAARTARVQALLQMPSPLLYANRRTLANALLSHRMPAMCESKAMVVEGCLMSYGPNFDAMVRRTAYFVDRILKGAKPADLPVEHPREYDFVINGNTARALGVSLPRAILLRATEVIE